MTGTRGVQEPFIVVDTDLGSGLSCMCRFRV